MLLSYPLAAGSASSTASAVTDTTAAAGGASAVLRAVYVKEEDTEVVHFSTQDAPKNMGDLLARFSDATS